MGKKEPMNIEQSAAKISRIRAWVLIGCFFNYTVGVGYAQTSLGGLLPIMAKEYGWTTAQWGILAGALPLGVACIVLFAGVFIDKYSPRKVMIFAVLLMGVCVILRGVLSSFTLAFVAVLCSGFSSCIFETGNLKMATIWFDRKRMGIVNGVLMSGVAFGYFIGLTLSMKLTEMLGSWQKQFYLMGAVILGIALIWAFAVPDRKRSVMDEDLHIDEAYLSRSILTGLKDVFKSKQALLCIATETFTNAPIFAFSTIGPLAFVQLWGISQSEANWIVSISSLCGILGYTVIPWISRNYGKRKPLSIPCLIISTALYCTSLFTHHAGWSMFMIGLAGTLNGWGLVGPRLMMLEHKDIAGVNAGTATGAFFCISKFFQFLVPTLFVWFNTMLGSMYLGWSAIYIIGELGVIFLMFAADTGVKSAYTKRMEAEMAAKQANAN